MGDKKAGLTIGSPFFSNVNLLGWISTPWLLQAFDAFPAFWKTWFQSILPVFALFLKAENFVVLYSATPADIASFHEHYEGTVARTEWKGWDQNGCGENIACEEHLAKQLAFFLIQESMEIFQIGSECKGFGWNSNSVKLHGVCVRTVRRERTDPDDLREIQIVSPTHWAFHRVSLPTLSLYFNPLQLLNCVSDSCMLVCLQIMPLSWDIKLLVSFAD